jgi:ATP-binding cassette subfamily B protein
MYRSNEFLRYLRRIGRYLKPHWLELLIAVGTLSVVTGIHLVRPWILRELIDDVIPRRDVSQALKLGLAFVGALGIGGMALYLRAILLARVGTGIMARLKGEVFGHLLAQGMAFHDGHPPGKLISRVENDIEQLRGLFSGAVVQLAASLLLLAAITGMIRYQAPELGDWLMTAIGVIGVVLVFYARFIRGMWREIRERTSEISSRLTEFIQGVALLKLFGKEEVAVTRVMSATREKCDLESRALFFETVVFYGTFSFLAEIGVMALLIWYGTGEILHGRMTIGTLVMFLELMRRFFGPLRELAEVLMQLQSGLAACGRVFGLLDLIPEEASSPVSDGQIIGTPESRRFREIGFDGVSFSYGREKVLRDVSFIIPRGKRIAIVGPSGSGKTTCINLLLRFYDPEAGAIRIDGRDLRSMPPEEWRQRVALVLQEIHLFPGTIMENLKAFSPEVHDGRVIAAARELGAHEFISALPDGYQTQLAERGANLSLGERQLLCYVRALVRNPELLILDEATSAVDAVTERRLQTAMERLMSRRTAVIIAHRLSTITSADSILVLDQGRLVEQGTHYELLARPGVYRSLATLQGLAGTGTRAGIRRRRSRPVQALAA